MTIVGYEGRTSTPLSRQWCLAPLLPFSLQPLEHHVSPHLGQLGKLAPLLLQATHTDNDLKCECCSRSTRVGWSCPKSGDWFLGVVGASEEEAVDSEAVEFVRRRSLFGATE